MEKMEVCPVRRLAKTISAGSDSRPYDDFIGAVACRALQASRCVLGQLLGAAGLRLGSLLPHCSPSRTTLCSWARSPPRPPLLGWHYWPWIRSPPQPPSPVCRYACGSGSGGGRSPRRPLPSRIPLRSWTSIRGQSVSASGPSFLHPVMLVDQLSGLGPTFSHAVVLVRGLAPRDGGCPPRSRAGRSSKVT